VAVGVTCAGERDILGLWAGDGGEGAKFFLAVLTEIKNRGAGDVCIVVCDGLKGLPEAVNTVWDHAVIQTCVIHLLRNTFRYASRKYWDQIAKDIRPVYTAPTEAAAKERFVEFTAKWGAQYPAIIRLWGERLERVRAVPGLRRRDPPSHLLDECRGVDQRPLPPRDPRPRAFPDRTSCPEVSLPRHPITGSDREG
jgi:transposase-like protein